MFLPNHDTLPFILAYTDGELFQVQVGLVEHCVKWSVRHSLTNKYNMLLLAGVSNPHLPVQCLSLFISSISKFFCVWADQKDQACYTGSIILGSCNWQVIL